MRKTSANNHKLKKIFYCGKQELLEIDLNQPTVSVVMSAYNRPQYVKLAIESILNQTYKDFEFIIIDDCSTDNTAAVIQEYANKDERIIFIRNSKNMDYNYNLRQGFDLAKGKYIARMDDDDISMPTRFAKQVRYLNEHQDITVLGSFINIIGNEEAKSWVNITDADELNVAMNFYNPICHPSVMIRKSFLKTHKLNYSPEELYAEEYHLWKEIILRGGKLANLSEKLINYRVHKKSVTQVSKTSKIQTETAQRVRRHLLSRFFSKKETNKIIDSVFIYPFEQNNKKKINDILEKMKKFSDIVDLSGIKKFEQRYVGQPCVMDIFFAADNNFAQHLCVAMTSILLNASSFDKHNFYILDGGISDKNKKIIDRVKKIKNCQIEYLKIDDNLFQNCPITSICQHISKQTYYRYIISDLKPELDKCLYLDADIVVDNSLNEFWNLSLDDNYAAVVEELWQFAHNEYIRKWNINQSFNAGIMLINLKKWRQDNIVQKLFTTTAELVRKNELQWQDQDVLNYTFKDKVIFVSPKFNLQQTAYFDGQHSLCSEEQMHLAKTYPTIIHYSGNIKPWQRGCKHPLWKKYYQYLKKSPYAGKYYKRKLYNKINQFIKKIYSKETQGNYSLFHFLFFKIKKISLSHIMKEVNYIHGDTYYLKEICSDIQKNLVSVRSEIEQILSIIKNLRQEFVSSDLGGDKLYDNPGEKNLIKNFLKYYRNQDKKKLFFNLIKDLDDTSINTVTITLKRLEIVDNAEYKPLDIYTPKEKLVFNDINVKYCSYILKLDEDLYNYKHYLLPKNDFEVDIFYEKYGLNFVDTSKFYNKDIIDAGAYIGDSALLLQEYTSKNIYAFEPEEASYKLLEQTIKLNGTSRIIPQKYGLSANGREYELQEDGLASSIVNVDSEKNNVQKIKTVTIDNFVRENQLEIGLIKLDVEGFEQQVLKGAEETICQQKPILLISIYHNADDFFNIKPWIESLNLGYKFKIFKPTNSAILAGMLLIAESE